MKTSKPLHRPAVRVALGVALVLLLPLVAMQFTDEVVWTLWDFIVVGVLLTAIGVAIELAVEGGISRSRSASVPSECFPVCGGRPVTHRASC